MKKLIITFLLCGWALNLHAMPPFTSYGGSGTASDITFDNTEASLTDDPDDVQGAIEAVKTEIDNISVSGLTDIDDLPGDAVNDGKIDSSLINNATSTGLGVASFPNTTFTVSTAGAVSIKANVFQPYSATLADFSEGSPTGTYDLSGATITFGLKASDIPDLSGTYATAGHDHTGTYEPADATIMKTGSYANLTAINAVSPSSGYLRYNGSAFVYDTPSGTEHDAVTLGVDADTILGLSTQQITLDTQTANYVFAGPATGEAADPTFRALVADDIPDLSGTYQTADAVLAALAALANDSGVLTNDGSGNLSWAAGGGSMVYPGAGVPFSTGSAWGTSLTVGTGASNLVQLDESGKLPAVDGSSLTGLFDPASPGEIGGTTPAAGDFTDVTADSYATNQSATQAGQWYGSELSGNGTDYQAWEVADEITTSLILKFPDANPLANSIQIFGAPIEGKSTFAWLQITGNSKYFGTDGSGTVGIHDLPAASSGLPEGGTAGQIIVKTESGAEWQNFEDHPAYTTLLNAFLAAGLNTFTFTPDNPASYPYYSATGTFNLDFEVTDTSTAYTIAGVRYKLDEGGYDGNSASDQGSNIWRVALAALTEDTYTLQLEAKDSKGTPNTGESSEYTVIVDTTDPVINLSAGANPTTHDGSGNDTWDLQIGMITETYIDSIQYRLTVDGGETPEWSTWASPWTTTGIPLPEVDEDLHIAVKVTDLAGNWDTGGITVASATAGGCTGVQGNNSTTEGAFQAVTIDYLCLSQVTLSCGGTPTSINARTMLFVADGESAVFVVYSDSGGAPGTRLWYGANDIYDAGQSSKPTVLTDTSISAYTFSAGTYWIGIAAGAPGRVYGPSDTGGVMVCSPDVWTDVFPVPPATAPTTLTAGEKQLAIWLEFP